MIKPVVALSVDLSDDSSFLYQDELGGNTDVTPNAGTNARRSLLFKEDIHEMVEVGPDEYAQSIVPYHAVNSAMVEHTSLETEDPVDELCVADGPAPEPETIYGLWKLKDSFAEGDNATYNVTFRGLVGWGTESAGYSAITVNNGTVLYGTSEAYKSGNWAIPNNYAEAVSNYIYITAVEDDSHDELLARLKEHAEHIVKTPSIEGTKWQFMETPSFSIFKPGSNYTYGSEVVGEGVPATVNSLLITSATGITARFPDTLLYDASSGVWTGLPDRTLTFGAGNGVTDSVFVAWLSANATQITE